MSSVHAGISALAEMWRLPDVSFVRPAYVEFILFKLLLDKHYIIFVLHYILIYA